jgi:hypothetical protein
MELGISGTAAPALGDLRALKAGDTVWVYADANGRADWARYADAIVTAVTRGADVRHAS